MILSIRKFLLINLLLAVSLTTTLTVVGNYYLDQQDIQDHLDTLLSQAALSFQALISDDSNDLKTIQKSLDAVPLLAQTYLDNRGTKHMRFIKKNIYYFQAWTYDGKLLLSSISAPKEFFTPGLIGFSDRYINGELWRVFATDNPKLHLYFVVAERYDLRNELAFRITKDDVYILLVTIPLAGLLIWFIIGRGLSSLQRIAYELSNRAPSHLDPVDIKAVPIEIKPLIDELNKLFLRLQQAFEREKRFAADAAHELRTPLAALKTQAQVALKTHEEKERHIILQNVIAGVDRSAHVVQQLLTLSRLVPEASAMNDLTVFNLGSLTAEIIAQLAPTALDKHIDIELNTGNEVFQIMGNITAMSILIRNLIDNAIRYTPEHGAVKVSLSHHDDRVILRVTDTGPGIPAELRSRVFERFFRVLGNKSSGSGLGLAIVQQIAKLHYADVKLGTPLSGTGLEVEVSIPNADNTTS